MSAASVASRQPTSAAVRAIGPETGGVMLIIAGLAFIVERFAPSIFLGVAVWRWLPLFVIYLGARDLRDPAPGHRRTILLLLAGIWLQVSALNVFGFDFLNAWPLLVVLVGLGLIIDSIMQDGPGGERLPQGE